MTEQIGAGVVQSLKPEYDVHFILDAENASREILSVLRGEALPTPSSHLGSRLYGTGEALRPRAVLFGGAYEDGVIEMVGEEVWRQLLQSSGGGSVDRAGRCCKPTTVTKIPLLKANQTATMPPLGPEYGKKMVQRAKACLRRLEEEGKFDGTHGGVYLY
ncbi:hypothetical protein PG994_001616 [Apiospora phragmitis]|uniref:Uncharacterized protein n=1 Tax=Apiospora phragmitis TaxID=2905665 RepID=A0ABR1WU60_9PEZI